MMSIDGEADRLIEEYLNAVNEVKAKDQNGEDRFSTEEKLRRLLPPLRAYQALHDPRTKKRDLLLYDISVDIKNELDYEHLTQDSKRYDVNGSINLGEAWLLDAHDECIWVNDRYLSYMQFRRDTAGNHGKPISEADFQKIYDKQKGSVEGTPDPYDSEEPEGETVSLHDLFELWLPLLRWEHLTSNDFLEQLLVCYTIKRASSGDRRAQGRLYRICEKRATSMQSITAVKKLLTGEFYRERQKKYHGFYKDYLNEADADAKAKEVSDQENMMASPIRDTKIETGKEEASDVKQMLRIYLHLILCGFDWNVILDDLLSDDKIFSIPSSLKKFFVRLFTETVPDAIKSIASDMDMLLHIHTFFQKTAELMNQISYKEPMAIELLPRLLKKDRQVRNAIFDLSLTFETLLDPHSPIIEDQWISGDGKIRKFNDMCYRPQKMGPRKNLVRWLFGFGGHHEYGTLHQLARDHLLSDVKEESRPEPFDPSKTDKDHKRDNPIIGVEPHVLKYQYETWRSANSVSAAVDDVLEMLHAAGISEKHIEIFKDLADSTQKEVAKKHGLSDRQIRNINTKVRTIFKK